MGTTIHTALAAEDGASIGGNTAWLSTGSNVTITPGSTERMGIRFTTIPFDTLGDPASPIFQPIEVYRSFTLTLQSATVGGAAGTLTVYMSEEVDPAAFSNSRVPGSTDLTEVEVASSALDPFITQDTSITLDASEVNRIHNHLGFQGNMAFTLGWTSTAGTVVILTANASGFAPTLTTDGEPFITGIKHEFPPGHTTIERCTKSGFLLPRAELIEDGFTGALVRRESWDPPDVDLDDPVEPFRRGT